MAEGEIHIQGCLGQFWLWLLVASYLSGPLGPSIPNKQTCWSSYG